MEQRQGLRYYFRIQELDDCLHIVVRFNFVGYFCVALLDQEILKRQQPSVQRRYDALTRADFRDQRRLLHVVGSIHDLFIFDCNGWGYRR